MKKILVLLSIYLASFYSVAQVNEAVIKKSLEKLGFEVTDILPSPLDNLLTVLTNDGVFYVSTDGQYMLQAPLYKVSGKTAINVTNLSLMKRLETFADQMIVYQAPNEKRVVTVFTDTSCGYCIKLHKEMGEYNKRGITIRYLAFPRQGIDSINAQEMESIWCAADPKKAFDEAVKGKKPQAATCKIDVANHYRLGVQFGVRGTPAMIVGDIMIPGYQDAKGLEEFLAAYQVSAK